MIAAMLRGKTLSIEQANSGKTGYLGKTCRQKADQMQRRVLEIKKKVFGGINLTWRRIIDEAGKNQGEQTWRFFCES